MILQLRHTLIEKLYADRADFPEQALIDQKTLLLLHGHK